MHIIDELSRDLKTVLKSVFDVDYEIEQYTEDGYWLLNVKGEDYGIGVYDLTGDYEFRVYRWEHSGGWSYENPPESDIVESKNIHTNFRHAIIELIHMMVDDYIQNAFMNIQLGMLD